MSYTEVTILTDGALSDTISFGTGLGEQVDELIADCEREATQNMSVHYEIFIQFHPHSEMDECICNSYRTHGKPDVEFNKP